MKNAVMQQKIDQIVEFIRDKIVLVKAHGMGGGVAIVIPTEYSRSPTKERTFRVTVINDDFSLGNSFVHFPQKGTWRDIFEFLEANKGDYSYRVIDASDLTEFVEKCFVMQIPKPNTVVICNFKESDGTIRRRLGMRLNSTAWKEDISMPTWVSVNETKRDEWYDAQVESWEEINLNK